jgi:hypothetical protein
MKTETLKKYIGNTFGVLTVISLNNETYDKEKQSKRSYFYCKCNRCNENCIARSDRLTLIGNYLPKSCTHCVDDRQKETAEIKYKIKDTKHIRNRISSIKGAAKSRNISMQLSDTQIESFLNKKCYYCNENNAMGIDRLNSKEPYCMENCVTCCFICNRIKNKYSLELFLDKVSKIYYNFHNRSSTTIPKGSTLQVNGSGNGEALN